jgi:uncharacterized OB-fold protein
LTRCRSCGKLNLPYSLNCVHCGALLAARADRTYEHVEED